LRVAGDVAYRWWGGVQGGQAQRVVIAIAVALKPEILLLVRF
jgi:ABC-type sulfate/molybdate transport systems ATPase subunit